MEVVVDSINIVERRKGLSLIVAKQLHDTLLSGAFKPGDALPAQRALASQFGTSIAAIREAMSVLTALGLLEVHQGRGTTVARAVHDDWTFDGWLGLTEDPRTIHELIELRWVLERHAVAKAAKVIDDDGRRALGVSVHAMGAAIARPVDYLQADFAFHRLIAELAGNAMLARVITSIRTPFKWLLHVVNVRHLEQHGTLRVSFEAHERLVDAINRGDPELAQERLDAMIERAYVAFGEGTS